jgi:amino acid transporter
MANPSIAAPHTLVRALGRWSLAGIILNIVIGASAFGVPAGVAALLGPASPWAFVIGGVGMLMIGTCFAEVASYFDQTGGPYLYARHAYGPFVGIFIAWLMCLVRVAAAAAVCNLFVTYVAQFWPPADEGAARVVLLTLLLATFAAVNVLGVRIGANASNGLAILKIGTLALFGVGGLLFLALHHSPGAAAALQPVTGNSWLEAFVLTVFSYGGIEVGLVVTGEAKQARRNAPFAVFAVLGVAVVLYTLVQVAVTYTLPGAATSKRAVAEASAVIFSGIGESAPALMSVVALISVVGYLMAAVLTGPRILYALSEQGDLPPFFARVHPHFRTPHTAIVFFTVVIWALAVWGSFRSTAVISAVTRLFVYAAVCGAVFVFRRRPPLDTVTGAPLNPEFRTRFVPFAALLGIAFCGLLLTLMGRVELIVMAVVAAIATATWLWRRRAARS